MRGIALVAAAGLVAAGLAVAPSAAAEPTAVTTSVRAAAVFEPAAAKYKFKNCTALNKVYPHGVGKSGAKDKTSGTPVTNFRHSTSLYKKIIKYRKSHDRDKDGIACEKK